MTSLRKIEQMIAEKDIKGLKAWLLKEPKAGWLGRMLAEQKASKDVLVKTSDKVVLQASKDRIDLLRKAER
jgi:hypothetical protein